MSRRESLIEEVISLVQSEKIPLPSQDEFYRFLSVVANSGVPGKSEKAAAALKLPQKELRVTRDFEVLQ